MDIVQEQVSRLVSKGDAKLSIGFVFGLGMALWSANAGVKAIIDALNVVYDEKEKRGFIKLNLGSLAFTAPFDAQFRNSILRRIGLRLLKSTSTSLGLSRRRETRRSRHSWRSAKDTMRAAPN